ncbi:MAG: MFS transporter [Streptosporangiales bacterium]|nr:MFS transporter [Streptosporangiales bacterium]
MRMSMATPPPQDRRMARKALVAASIGNFVEWYDFAVYGYSAAVIATTFFPAGNATVGLLGTLAIFGVTFFLRPLGGILLGRLGDRVGRRPVLSLTVLLMGIATALMGLLPTYASIGIAAPLLLLVLRLAQGFFGGGEFSGASTYLVEYAPPHRRGLWATLSMATGVFPFAICGLVVFGVSASMSEQAYGAYGWRLPFLFALPLALVGLYLRMKIEETPEFRAVKEAGTVERSPMRTLLTHHRRAVLLVLAIASLNAVGSYTVTSYMPTFLTSHAHLSQATALIASSAAVAILACLLPIAGSIGDRVGRRPVIVVGTIGIVLLAVPGYLLAGQGGMLSALIGQLLMIVPLAGISAVLGPSMCELFPTHVRYSGSALGYNVAYALFGGTAPFVAQSLISRTETPIAPAFYLVVFGLVCLVAVLKLPETSRFSLATAAVGDEEPPHVPISQENAR